MDQNKKGVLYLIPTTLGETDPSVVLPEGTLAIIRKLDHFIVENLRSARRFLSKTGNKMAINELTLSELDKHNIKEDMMKLLLPALEGINIGLMSEAGSPCVADPGSLVVETAHKLNLRVVPLSGPNAVLMALMASGFNGQHFLFHGYLPIKPDDRQRKLKKLENQSRENGQTQIFIETPYRNKQLYEAIVQVCRPDTMLCIAVNLTLEDEDIRSMPVHKWKKQSVAFDKKPAVFLIWHPGPYAKQQQTDQITVS
jgi:16S rRNA (cytidine1402-2'-O)-methyltransferase